MNEPKWPEKVQIPYYHDNPDDFALGRIEGYNECRDDMIAAYNEAQGKLGDWEAKYVESLRKEYGDQYLPASLEDWHIDFIKKWVVGK